MLAQGIIRESTSPFFSPALNNCTIKDTFPILVVDELLDEVKGARFFTKIDLRSGYHLHMHPDDDVTKAVFRSFQVPRHAFRPHQRTRYFSSINE